MEELYQKLRFSIKEGMQALEISPTESDNIELIELEKYLVDLSVINYDLKQIGLVIHNAINTPEIIGPVFEKFDTTKTSSITVDTDGLTAKVTINGNDENFLSKITYDDIYYKLKLENILGEFINSQEIIKIVEEKIYNKAIIVASAKNAINGDNAKIEYKIDIENVGTPRELEDGRADFKNIGKVLIVTAKQILAEKIPLTEGTDGINLYGEELPAVAGEDIGLPAGKNTSISDDTLKLFSNVDGYVYRSDLGINIGETFMVEGDLDFNTGNIEYNSDVFIKKNVLPDFKVISENGDIYIEGEVDNAYIEAKNGNVIIKKGIFGEKTVIKGNEIKLDFIQGEASVTGDEIIINKFSYGANLKAINSIQATSIMGGSAECQKEIITDEIGTESHTETVITIFNERVQKISELLENGDNNKSKLEKHFAEISKQIQMIKRTLAIKKNITDSDKARANKKIVEYNEAKDWLEKLEKNMQILRDERFEILSAAGAKIEIKKKLYPNVKISFFANRYFSKELYETSKTIDINTLKL